MVRTSLKLLIRGLAFGIIVPFLLVLSVLLGSFIVLQFRPIPLAPFAGLAAGFLERWSGAHVELHAPVLRWSRQRGAPYLEVARIDYNESDDVFVSAHQIVIANDREALWSHGAFAFSILRIGRLELRSAHKQAFVAGIGIAQNFISGDGHFLRHIDELTIADIMLLSADEAPTTDKKSYVSLVREGDTLTGMAHLSYQNAVADNTRAQLTATAQLAATSGGEIKFAFNNLYPTDSVALGGLFAPLAAFDAPANFTAGLRLDANFQPSTATLDLYLGEGIFHPERLTPTLPTGVFAISKAHVVMDADFKTASLTMQQGHFYIDDSHLNLTGQFTYEIGVAGLRSVAARLKGASAEFETSSLFAVPLQLQNIKSDMLYDNITQTLHIEHLSADDETGAAVGVLTGAFGIEAIDGATRIVPTLDVNVAFAPMPTPQVLARWPVRLAPRARGWITNNLTDGRMLGANLQAKFVLNELLDKPRRQPLREEAIHFTLDFEDINLRVIKNMPRLEALKGQLRLNGKAMQIAFAGGTLQPPAPTSAHADTPTPPVHITGGTLVMEDYRDPNRVSDITFTAEGETKSILRLVNAPPVRALAGVDFDFERMRGDVRGRVALHLPLIAAVPRDAIRFQVEAESGNTAISGQIASYRIGDIQATLKLDNQNFNMSGVGLVNAVPFLFDWRQDIGAAESSQLAISGAWGRVDLMALGQAGIATSIDGIMPTRILIEGNITNPTSYRIVADLTPTRFMPRPLAYQKEQGVAGGFTAEIVADGGVWQALDFRYHDANTPEIAGQLGFTDGHLSALTIPPFNLGQSRQLALNLVQDGAHRMFSVEGEAIYIVPPFSTEEGVAVTFNRSGLRYLGDQFAFHLATPILNTGTETLEGARLVIHGQDGRYEQASLQGHFTDGTHVYASLERESADARNYIIQTENAGALMRFSGFTQSLIGGSFLLQGKLHDTQQDTHADGHITLVDFKVRDLPLLVHILSLASIRGPVDLARGEGIVFAYGVIDYQLVGDILKLDDGRFGGGAVGLTVAGDYDVVTDEVHMGGTLVPAYQFNNALGRIPVLGRVFTNRKGEGLFGVGYRITGKWGDPSVLVNPASILAPGIVRRIFEFDVGLPEKQTVPNQ